MADIRLVAPYPPDALQGLDAIEGTPILDLKPVLREFLPRTPVRQPSWPGELMEHYWRVED